MLAEIVLFAPEARLVPRTFILYFVDKLKSKKNEKNFGGVE